MKVLVKRPARKLRAARPPEVGVPSGGCSGEPAQEIARLGIEPVPRARQPAELFHHHPIPARDIADQFFEHANRALAAAIINGLGDIDSPAPQIQRRNQPRADQVGKVRNHPGVAEINELVIPQMVVAAAQSGGLLRNDLHQGAQHARIVGKPVLFPVEGRDHFPDLLGEIGFEFIVRGDAHQLAAFPFRRSEPFSRSKYLPEPALIPYWLKALPFHARPVTATAPGTARTASKMRLRNSASPMPIRSGASRPVSVFIRARRTAASTSASIRFGSISIESDKVAGTEVAWSASIGVTESPRPFSFPITSFLTGAAPRYHTSTRGLCRRRSPPHSAPTAPRPGAP